MDLFKLLITNNLIQYLNNNDCYIELKCGIFKVKFKKVCDDKLIYDNIERITSGLYIPKFENMEKYVEYLLNCSLMYLIEGLECTVLVDIINIGYIECVNLNNINAFLVPKCLAHVEPLNFKLYDLNIDQISFDSIEFSNILKSIGSLFISNEHFIREQKRIVEYPYDYSIILDSTCTYVLHGEHSLLLRKLLNSPTVKCLRLDSSCKIEEILKGKKEALKKASQNNKSLRQKGSDLVKFIKQYDTNRNAHLFLDTIQIQ
jgi:hypothetical protein